MRSAALLEGVHTRIRLLGRKWYTWRGKKHKRVLKLGIDLSTHRAGMKCIKDFFFKFRQLETSLSLIMKYSLLFVIIFVCAYEYKPAVWPL